MPDVHAHQMPARSRLFSLPLRGSDGYTQEAILDYAQRLSIEHHVRVRDMFARIILPEAQIQGAFFIPGHFSARAVRGCNGWSTYAQAFLGAMQRLTGQMDVAKGSLAAWSPLFGASGYTARTRRWCVACLRSQKSEGAIGFSLLWSFEPVRVCPIHQLRLSESCGRCSRAQPCIADPLPQGLCAHCLAPLCDAPEEAVSLVAAGADYFKARSVAGMIAAGERAAGLATIATYRGALQRAADHLSNGSVHTLEKRLKLSHKALSAHGRRTLGIFLEVMYRLGAEPVPFLGGQAPIQPDPTLSETPYRTQQPFSKQEKAEVSARMEARVALALADETRLTTRLEVARDVGITNSYLQDHFPRVKDALRDHNARIRTKLDDALWARRTELIEKAMRELVVGRGPFNKKTIAQVLKQIGLDLRDPRVRKMAAYSLDRALMAMQSSFDF